MKEMIPTFLSQSGYHVKMTQEVVGLGGDALFGKAEMQTEVYKQLMNNWVHVFS